VKVVGDKSAAGGGGTDKDRQIKARKSLLSSRRAPFRVWDRTWPERQCNLHTLGIPPQDLEAKLKGGNITSAFGRGGAGSPPTCCGEAGTCGGRNAGPAARRLIASPGPRKKSLPTLLPHRQLGYRRTCSETSYNSRAFYGPSRRRPVNILKLRPVLARPAPGSEIPGVVANSRTPSGPRSRAVENGLRFFLKAQQGPPAGRRASIFRGPPSRRC